MSTKVRGLNSNVKVINNFHRRIRDHGNPQILQRRSLNTHRPVTGDDFALRRKNLRDILASACSRLSTGNSGNRSQRISRCAKFPRNCPRRKQGYVSACVDTRDKNRWFDSVNWWLTRSHERKIPNRRDGQDSTKRKRVYGNSGDQTIRFASVRYHRVSWPSNNFRWCSREFRPTNRYRAARRLPKSNNVSVYVRHYSDLPFDRRETAICFVTKNYSFSLLIMFAYVVTRTYTCMSWSLAKKSKNIKRGIKFRFMYCCWEHDTFTLYMWMCV